MKKVGLLIFTLLIFWVSACDDDAPDYPDTKLIKGQWQLVEDGSYDNPLIYRFTTGGENTWSWVIMQASFAEAVFLALLHVSSVL